MRMPLLRVLAAAFALGLLGGAACTPDPKMFNGCNPSQPNTGTAEALRPPDRVCAPGTVLDTQTRQCVKL